MNMCSDCESDGEDTPATEEWDQTGPSTGGLHLCDRHVGKRQDAYEPSTDDWSAGERNASGYAAQAAGRR